MKKRANGEGSIYTTIQKNKRKIFLEKECKICSQCTQKCDRLKFEKCDKCTNCTECLKYCDRYYCYKVTKAQISVSGKGRKSAGYGKNINEVKEKKDIKAREINKKELMKNADLTLSETMRENEKSKLKYKLINANSYHRNIQTIQLIEKYNISTKKMYEVTEDDLKELFSLLVDINTTQSVLDKVYDEIHQVSVYCKRIDLFENIKRNTFVSNVNKKKVVAFTIEEEKKLIKYINNNSNNLVNENMCNIDNNTVKNLIKFALATAMRIGEICALEKTANIDIDKKRIIVNSTLTKDINYRTIIGNNTKTGRKRKMAGENDIRYVPFDVLFNADEVEQIIKEQIKNSKSNLLFSNKNGEIIEHGSVNSIFKRICKNAGIEQDCNIHMTKHTGVTRMKENGMDIYAISKIVGTSVRILTKTYAHIFDDFIEREIEKSKKIRKENNLKLSTGPSSSFKILKFSKRAIY